LAQPGTSVPRRRTAREAVALLLVTGLLASCGDDDVDVESPRDEGGLPSQMDAARPTPDGAMDSSVRDASADDDANVTSDAAADASATANEFRVRFSGDEIRRVRLLTARPT